MHRVQALAPASTQAVGARSWAQASGTHGTQGDGESFFCCMSFNGFVCLQLSPSFHHMFLQVERDQTYRRHSLARNFPPCRRLATRTKLAKNRALQISGMGPDQASAPRVSNASFVSNNLSSTYLSMVVWRETPRAGFSFVFIYFLTLLIDSIDIHCFSHS